MEGRNDATSHGSHRPCPACAAHRHGRRRLHGAIPPAGPARRAQCRAGRGLVAHAGAPRRIRRRSQSRGARPLHGVRQPRCHAGLRRNRRAVDRRPELRAAGNNARPARRAPGRPHEHLRRRLREAAGAHFGGGARDARPGRRGRAAARLPGKPVVLHRRAARARHRLAPRRSRHRPPVHRPAPPRSTAARTSRGSGTARSRAAACCPT